VPLPRLSRFSRHKGGPDAQTRAVDDGARRPYLPPVPLALPSGGYPEWLARIARTLNTAIAGNLNCVADVSLSTGAATTVYDDRIGYWSVILPMPETATAAAALAGMWFQISSGQVIVHHPTSVATDRNLRLAILG